MQSFFGSLQSKFKATYAGRFFSTILAEVLQSNPQIVRAIFPRIPKRVEKALSDGDATVATEFQFAAGCRADLAIVEKGQPVALAEIKQADITSGRTTDQLKGYRRAVRLAAHRIDFSLLSQFQPYEEHAHVVRGSWGHGHGEIVRFYKLASKLERLSSLPPVELMLDYMKEQAMVGYAPLLKGSDRELKLLMTRLLPVRHSHGLGHLQSKDSIESASAVLGTLLNNVRYMEDWLRSANEHCFRRIFTTEFKVWPWYDTKALAAHLAGQNHGFYDLPDVLCTGGELLVYGQTVLAAKTTGAPKDMRLWLGYGLELELSSKKLSQTLYAGCGGPRSLFPTVPEPRFEYIRKCSYSSSESKVRKTLAALLNELLDEASEASYSKKLSKFLGNISLDGL